MRDDAIRIRTILLVFPLAILVVALVGGHVLVWRLFYLSVLLLPLSYLWVRLGIRGIEGQVKKSVEHCQVGESFDEEAVISNVSVLPKLLVRVWENSDLPGHTNRLVVNIPPQGIYDWQTKIYCRHRGRYYLGSLTVEVADPFGLFRVRRKLGETHSLLVYPAAVELPFLPLMSHMEFGAGRNYWLAAQPSPVISHVREYVPGDSLDHIHWRSTAHAGKLMVKDFGVDLPRNIWIVLDMSKASPARSDNGAAEEYCVSVAASLVKKYVDDGRPVGLIAQGDKLHVFPPEVGHKHFWQVMEALALVKAEGQVPIYQLIDREAERLGNNSIVVVVTGSTVDELGASLLRLNNRVANVIMILLDAASLGNTVNPQGIASRFTSIGIPIYVVKQAGDSNIDS